MKKLFSIALFLWMALFARAQNCTGPFNTHTFTVSDPYWLGNGNMGIAILYRNSNFVLNSLAVEAFQLTVTTEGCDGCSPLLRAHAPELTNFAINPVVSNNNHTATLSFNACDAGNVYDVVDNSVFMVLELAPCCDAIDVDIEMNFFVAGGQLQCVNDVVECDREVLFASCGFPGCNANYTNPGFFPSPFAQPTIAVSAPYMGQSANPQVAIQFFDPNHDPWVNINATPLRVMAVQIELYLSGDLQLLSIINNTFPAGSVTVNGNHVSINYVAPIGQPLLLFSSDIMIILEVGGGCGRVNICRANFWVLDAQVYSLTQCERRVCPGDANVGGGGGGGRGKMMQGGGTDGFSMGLPYPNPFTEDFTIPFYQETGQTVRITVMDEMGKVVLTDQIQSTAGENTYRFKPGSEVAAGTYFYTLESEGTVLRGKVGHVK